MLINFKFVITKPSDNENINGEWVQFCADSSMPASSDRLIFFTLSDLVPLQLHE